MYATPDTAPQRILLVRLSHLGDVVLALPVYHALRAAYPRAEIAWAVQPEFSDLVRGLPGVHKAVCFERRGGWRAWPKLRRELEAFGPDLAVDAQGNLKSAAALLCSGAPRRVGLHPTDWRERFGSRVLTEWTQAPGEPAVHAAERMERLARHFEPTGELRFDPDLTEAEARRGEELAEEWLPAGEAPWIVHLAVPRDVRSWPLEHYRALLRRRAAEGRPTLVLSGPGEVREGVVLREELPTQPALRHWVGQRGLRDLAAFFAAAALRGANLLGCDSGPVHLAAACGLPTLTLAGPQDAARTGPRPRDRETLHRALRAPLEPACAPCFDRKCRHERGPVCMSEIRPEHVVESLEEAVPCA